MYENRKGYRTVAYYHGLLRERVLTPKMFVVFSIFFFFGSVRSEYRYLEPVPTLPIIRIESLPLLFPCHQHSSINLRFNPQTSSLIDNLLS
jgi:hypothetical protein